MIYIIMIYLLGIYNFYEILIKFILLKGGEYVRYAVYG